MPCPGTWWLRWACVTQEQMGREWCVCACPCKRVRCVSTCTRVHVYLCAHRTLLSALSVRTHVSQPRGPWKGQDPLRFPEARGPPM